MKTDRYNKEINECRCGRIIETVNSFLDITPFNGTHRVDPWCSILCSLMEAYDDRFFPNNSIGTNSCICPSCGRVLCGVCSKQIFSSCYKVVTT